MYHFVNYSSQEAKFQNKILLEKPGKTIVHSTTTNNLGTKGIRSKGVITVKTADSLTGSAVKDYYNAKKASTTNTVPNVGLLNKDTPGYTSYVQDYSGQSLKESKLSPKQEYRLGSQIARSQNRLYDVGMLHADIHPGNITIPNPRKNKAFLVDNESLVRISGTPSAVDMAKDLDRFNLGMSEPFKKGFYSRAKFSCGRRSEAIVV